VHSAAVPGSTGPSCRRYLLWDMASTVVANRPVIQTLLSSILTFILYKVHTRKDDVFPYQCHAREWPRYRLNDWLPETRLATCAGFAYKKGIALLP
jgi:hypothetical protein